jgi:hypothetical protein
MPNTLFLSSRGSHSHTPQRGAGGGVGHTGRAKRPTNRPCASRASGRPQPQGCVRVGLQGSMPIGSPLAIAANIPATAINADGSTNFFPIIQNSFLVKIKLYFSRYNVALAISLRCKYTKKNRRTKIFFDFFLFLTKI